MAAAPKVIGRRTEKRGGKTYKVVILAPGRARGQFFAREAWRKPLTRKRNKGLTDSPLMRGDRMLSRGEDTEAPRPNDERTAWLRPEDHSEAA